MRVSHQARTDELELLKSIQNADFRKIKKKLAKNKNLLNTKDKRNNNVLHLAAMHSQSLIF
jgi:hypothetical protein